MSEGSAGRRRPGGGLADSGTLLAPADHPGDDGGVTVDDTNQLFRSLLEHEVRFLVAGGLAVVAHGHVRYTADLDLLVDLAPENVARLEQALGARGYRPRAPVRVADLADAGLRNGWIQDKGFVALSF